MQSHYLLVQRAKMLCIQANAINSEDEKSDLCHSINTIVKHFICGEYCYDGDTLNKVQRIQYHLLTYLHQPLRTKNALFHYEQALCEVELLFISLKDQGLIEEENLRPIH
ncbi:hypothetical protein [uncultured Shewanella sp.]|uniref:hypothetical protein n=1 Tax=uncultured Shewanella sp. TaxID=173975 RepID=UPI002635A8B6|nr:hypothetical protein [uncultured Shewanella sp.]